MQQNWLMVIFLLFGMLLTAATFVLFGVFNLTGSLLGDYCTALELIASGQAADIPNVDGICPDISSSQSLLGNVYMDISSAVMEANGVLSGMPRLHRDTPSLLPTSANTTAPSSLQVPHHYHRTIPSSLPITAITVATADPSSLPLYQSLITAHHFHHCRSSSPPPHHSLITIIAPSVHTMVQA